VNHIDKGGFSALDFAVMNRNMEIVSMLLAANADVLHINEIFVVKRKNILSYVSDPDIRTLVEDRISVVQKLLQQKRAQREQEAMVAAALLRIQERHQKILEDRRLRAEAKVKAINDRYAAKMRSRRVRQVELETAALGRKYDFDVFSYGEWEKDNVTNNWSFKTQSNQVMRHEGVIPASKKLMKKLKERNKIDIFNDRWRAITGRNLEVSWKKWAVFDDVGEEDQREGKDKVGSKLGGAGEEEREEERRDENDKELEDGDLDDLIQGP